MVSSGITLISVFPGRNPSRTFGEPFIRLQLLALALAVSANSQQLTAGNLLKATARSHDPDFTRTVVLLIHYDSEAAIGLILNKPTDVPLTDVLPEAKGKAMTLYAGGPISIGVRGLVRTASPPFFSVVTNKAELLRRIASGEPSSTFRVYAGYTGWSAQQLQSEVAQGLWKVLPADTGTLWRRWEHSPEGSALNVG
jgi:putative transcriptional regulator